MAETAGEDTAWRLPAPDPFRLAPTVHSHGAFQCPPFRWDADEVLLLRALPDLEGRPRGIRISEVLPTDGAPPPGAYPGPVDLRLETPGWVPSAEERSVLEERVVFMLGLDRDLTDFYELCRSDPVLRRIPEIGAGRMLRCPTLWEELVKAICGTNVRWSQAVTMIEAVASLGKPVKEGESDLRAWPMPRAILEAGEEWLRQEARLGYRAPYVIELARRIEEGSLDPGPVEAGALGRDELRALFLSVPGIGPTTTDHLLTLYGHTERLSVDAAVIAYMRDRHFGGRTPEEDEIRAHFEPYGRWRALAYWFELAQESWWPAIGVSF